jgi:hypothetical protein
MIYIYYYSMVFGNGGLYKGQGGQNFGGDRGCHDKRGRDSIS